MTIKTCALIIAAAMGLSSASACAALGAQSDFNTGIEGWVLAGDSTTSVPNHVPVGGNPDGFIHGDDLVTGGTWYWQAPLKFLGDNSAAYGSTLTYDQRMRGSNPSDLFTDHDIVLASPTVTLYYDFIGASPTKVPKDLIWTSYSIPLTEAGWKLSNTLLPPSQAVFQNVLANTTLLKIRGEFLNGADNGDLDNVVLAVPVPAAVWLFASALAGIGVFGRRKSV